MGGTIRKMPTHIQGSQVLTIDRPNLLTKDKGSISVYESHAFCVARLPAQFVGLAGSIACKYELFAHDKKPVFGTQFHPEKSGADGLDLLLNFVTLRHEQFYLQGKNV
jgi:GMP synthase (glutamine-hydrolysing)